MPTDRKSSNGAGQIVCPLDEDSLDRVVEAVQAYAKKKKIDSAAAIRYGFLIDNALDYWLQHGARGQEIKVTLGRRLFTPFITIEMAGTKLDPYPLHSQDYGTGGYDIAVYTSQMPVYEYRDEVNTLSLALKREKKMIRQLATVVALAVIAGLLGNMLLSEPLREEILSTVIDPIIGMFFNLLRCIAGPMVLLSVIWGICGIGDSRIFGRVGKTVLLYSVGVTACGAFVGALCFPFLGNGFADASVNGGALSSLLQMLLNIVPSSIVDPFSTGNTLQIIFLAMAVGLALISLSSKVGQLVAGVSQFNHVVQYLMEAISKLVPYIVFLLITEMVWTGSLTLITSMWRFFIALAAAFLLISIALCAFTASRNGVGFFTVAKKNTSTFLISLTTASSAASFASNVRAAKEKYGISSEMTAFSIPLGMIMHNPVAACYNILIIIYFAAAYGVNCSFSWLAIGVVFCTVIALSTPPIPGGAAASYALLFAQMGISEEALAVVLILDVITDFIVTAFECYVLPISLVNIAGKMGQLNLNILKNKKK